jgi:Cu/Ag efflux protein CusF
VYGSWRWHSFGPRSLEAVEVKIFILAGQIQTLNFLSENAMKIILSKLLMLVAMLYTSLVYAATDEFVAHIVDIDLESAEVTLLAKDINHVEYRLAYDVRIRLANGQKGAVANLRKGNQITAVGDPDTQVLYVIQVLN